MSDIKEAVKFNMLQKPVEFQQATNNLLDEKAKKVLEARKQDLAKNMFVTEQNAATSPTVDFAKMRFMFARADELEEQDDAKKELTAAQMKKRDEIADAIKRTNPGMDDQTRYAIATNAALNINRNSGMKEQKASKELTDAQMKKRDEIADAIKKANPKMPDDMRYAIATASALKD